jgi:hypothetical protein
MNIESIEVDLKLSAIFVLFGKVSTTPDLNMSTVKQLQAELATAKTEIN